MIYSLIFICFLALFGLLYLIIHLFQRIKQLESQDFSTSKREIEETLTAYVTDIKEENEAFLKALQAKDKDLPLRPVDDETEKRQPESYSRRPEKQETAFSPPVNNEADTFEQSLTSQVLDLNEQGMSVTEIAKKLNKGKGEIGLLLKFKKNI